MGVRGLGLAPGGSSPLTQAPGQAEGSPAGWTDGPIDVTQAADLGMGWLPCTLGGPSTPACVQRGPVLPAGVRVSGTPSRRPVWRHLTASLGRAALSPPGLLPWPRAQVLLPRVPWAGGDLSACWWPVWELPCWETLALGAAVPTPGCDTGASSRGPCLWSPVWTGSTGSPGPVPSAAGRRSPRGRLDLLAEPGVPGEDTWPWRCPVALAGAGGGGCPSSQVGARAAAHSGFRGAVGVRGAF